MTRAVKFSVTVEALEKSDVGRYAFEMAKSRLGSEKVAFEMVEPFPRELYPGGPSGYTFNAWTVE